MASNVFLGSPRNTVITASKMITRAIPARRGLALTKATIVNKVEIIPKTAAAFLIFSIILGLMGVFLHDQAAWSWDKV